MRYLFIEVLLSICLPHFVGFQVLVQVLVFAFLVVAANTVVLAAFMLYGLNLKDTWTWTDAFLFATMIASTDAVAVTAIMKEGTMAPERHGIVCWKPGVFQMSSVALECFLCISASNTALFVDFNACLCCVDCMSIVKIDSIIKKIGDSTYLLPRWKPRRIGHTN